jgi:RNA polymerase sigma factor (sigma-70 family)
MARQAEQAAHESGDPTAARDLATDETRGLSAGRPDETFRERFQRTFRPMSRALARWCGDLCLAEDGVMVAFARMAKERDPKPDSWLFVAARHAIISEVRKRHADVTVLLPDVSRISFIDDPTNSVDTRIHLRRLLEALPPREYDAIILVDLEDFSYEDASSVMGCRPGTVKRSRTRGRARLKELMDNDEGD